MMITHAFKGNLDESSQQLRSTTLSASLGDFLGLKLLFFIFVLFGSLYSAYGQADDIACRSQINFSLDPSTCTGVVTPEMLLAGNETCGEDFVIILRDEHNRIVPNAFSRDDIGRNYTFMVCCEDNCCWGDLLVEYKSIPISVCPADDTIACAALDFYTFEVPSALCSDFAVEIQSQEKVFLDCDDELTAVVNREYRITDDYGNISRCNQVLSLARVSPDDLIFPSDAIISCSDTTMRFQADGSPFPWYYNPMTGSGTGIGIGTPLLCGAGYDTGFFCGGTGSGTPAIPIIPNGGAVIIVESGDIANPDINVEFIEESNTIVACNAVVTYSDVTFPAFNGECTKKIARTWELREWWCAEEFSFNSLQIIQIKDDMAPEYTCPENYTVTTTKDCAAEITLPRLNPVDMCGDSVRVQVMTPFGLKEGDGALVDLNVGENLLTFTVSDACYNSSSCQTVVTVSDLTDPVAICEASKVVALSTLNENKIPASVFDNASFDDCGIVSMQVRRMEVTCDSTDIEWSEYVRFCCEDLLTDQVMVAFRVLDHGGNQSVCMVSVEVQNKLTPELTCPTDRTIDCDQGYDLNNLGLTFGLPSLNGTCSTLEIPEESIISNVNQCGVGTIQRTFKLTDFDGNIIKKCTQAITITNESPFVVTNIQWPGDYEHNGGCSGDALHPDFLPQGFGYPILYGADNCALLGYDFDDKIYASSVGSFECLVIERTWTVVNWCGEPGNEIPTWTNPQPQLIKIRNTVAPILDNNMSIVFDVQGQDCDSGAIIVSRSATDDCDNELFWQYHLKNAATGVIVASGNTNTIEGSFPIGKYLVEWSVNDGCGNVDSDVQTLDIYNNKPPTPVCHNGLSGSLVGVDTDGDGTIDTEDIELWASDFDAGSYPNCNSPITFSFSQDTTDNLLFFDCADLGRQEVTLWVTDVNTGAQSHCISFIDVQDAGACPDAFRVAVQGEVYTEDNQMIEGVEVSLDDQTHEYTDDKGTYAFANMPLGGNYNVEPVLDKDYLNGISTLDIIMIQRHILGIQELDSPYKLLAADVNNSEDINGVDLVELRKLVLGIYDELPQNTSWRFISQDYIFANDTNPWASVIKDKYQISNLSSDMNLDFIGVKVGDVNQDAIVSLSSSKLINNSSIPTLELNFGTSHIEHEKVSTIQVTAQNYTSIVGWQGTLIYDTDKVELLNIEGVLLDLNMTHLNLKNAEEGMIAMSYDSKEELTLGVDDVLFEVTFESLGLTDTDENLFSITSDLVAAEAYNSNLEIVKLRSNKVVAHEAEIVSVSPNPFVNTANLEFYLPRDEKVTFDFFDVNGRLLMNTSSNYKAGSNVLELIRDDFETTGFVFIRMTTSNTSNETRIILF